jgi:hypothetical protein
MADSQVALIRSIMHAIIVMLPSNAAVGVCTTALFDTAGFHHLLDALGCLAIFRSVQALRYLR